MKKLLLITILVSWAWGQVCPYDGSGLSYRTGNIKQPRDGYISYEWICEGNAVRGNRHTNWSEEKIPSPTGADNTYQQQTQQQTQQQRVLPDYSPVIEAFKDKRTDEEKRRDNRRKTQAPKKSKKTTSQSEEGNAVLGFIGLYLLYLLTLGLLPPA